MKATTNSVASITNDMCPTSVGNADDIMLTSSSQNKGVHINYSTPTNKDPLEGKTTAVIAVMRGKPKHGYHRHCSNKHSKLMLVRVLLAVRQWFWRTPSLCEQGQIHADSVLKN